MEHITWSLVFLFSTTIAIFILTTRTRRKSKQYNLPPGPYAFPIIGSIIQLARLRSKRPALALQKLGETYGNIIGLQMGSVFCVGINGVDTIKELVDSPDFLDRINNNYITEKTLGLPLGLAFAETENKFWGSTRQISHRLIREYGFGKSETMYNLIMAELKDFIETWKEECSANPNGTAKLLIAKQFHAIPLNVIWSLGTGARFHSHDDPKMIRCQYLANEWISGGSYGKGLPGLFPKLIDWFPTWIGYDKHCGKSMELFDFFNEIIEERIRIGEYKNTPSNFVDSFLQSIEKNNKNGLINPKPELLDSVYTKENLIGVLQDFCIAGNDTTSSVLNFILRYLVQYPSEQEKLHEEINREIGHNRLVTMEDKPKLIYLRAVIFEGARLATVLRLPNFPRRAVRDAKFHGFDIPKGTVIIPNYYGSHFDETLWENPEIFRPQRFLNSTHTELINTDKLFVFGYGRRSCIGESIAKATLFLVLSTLLQQFKLEIDPDYGIPSSGTLEEGWTKDTAPYNILLRQK